LSVDVKINSKGIFTQFSVHEGNKGDVFTMRRGVCTINFHTTYFLKFGVNIMQLDATPASYFNVCKSVTT